MIWNVGLGFILGAILGSFIKATVDRTTKVWSFWRRSYCDSCRRQLAWYDLFPILSYIYLRGRCRFCHSKIPISALLTEVAVGLIVAVLFSTINNQDLLFFVQPSLKASIPLFNILFKLFVVVVLSIIFLIDLKTGLIPDKITFPGIIITAVYLLLFNLLLSWNFYLDIKGSPLGKYLLPPYSSYFWDVLQRLWLNVANNIAVGLAVSLFFVLLIIITKGKGMGWGDVKYVLFIGLVLGFPNALLSIFLSFLIGALFSVGLIVLGKKHFGQTIPFGPFLSLGAFITLLFGPQLINWYFSGMRLI